METVWRHSKAQIVNFVLKRAVNDTCVLCLCSGAKSFVRFTFNNGLILNVG
jgi:hypothetical protein